MYKFGGSSVRDAERMREVATIVCSFPEHLPCVVLSAMGKTTNNLLAAGEEAMAAKSTEVEQLPHLKMIRELHERTCQELALPEADKQEVAALLQQLTQLLTGISLMQVRYTLVTHWDSGHRVLTFSRLARCRPAGGDEPHERQPGILRRAPGHPHFRELPAHPGRCSPPVGLVRPPRLCQQRRLQQRGHPAGDVCRRRRRAG